MRRHRSRSTDFPERSGTDRQPSTGRIRLTWHVDPWWSLTALGPEFDIGVVGPGTELSGHVGLRGLSAEDIRLDALNGRLAWPLLAALVPDLPIGCDAAVTLEDVALRIVPGRRSGSGALRGGPGSCARTDGAEGLVVVPDFLGGIETSDDGLRLVVTGLDAPGTPLAEVEVSNDDRLIVTVSPEGAALVPGMPASGETLEYPLPELVALAPFHSPARLFIDTMGSRIASTIIITNPPITSRIAGSTRATSVRTQASRSRCWSSAARASVSPRLPPASPLAIIAISIGGKAARRADRVAQARALAHPRRRRLDAAPDVEVRRHRAGRGQRLDERHVALHQRRERAGELRRVDPRDEARGDAVLRPAADESAGGCAEPPASAESRGCRSAAARIATSP